MFYYINMGNTISFPVQNGSRKDYDQHSFGAPRVGHKHKGVDIFAPKGTNVISATRGFVIYTGVLKLGGNVVLVLGPDFRVYYYAHLDTILTNKFTLVEKEQIIGRVGKTGNARTTPPHLHFSISKIIPLNGKVFYDPVPILNKTFLFK
jgi:murein DD-endopeptidase MepM/ murein hydrolase activator NlpD